jgi:hypothetical protein
MESLKPYNPGVKNLESAIYCFQENHLPGNSEIRRVMKLLVESGKKYGISTSGCKPDVLLNLAGRMIIHAKIGGVFEREYELACDIQDLFYENKKPLKQPIPLGVVRSVRLAVAESTEIDS